MTLYFLDSSAATKRYVVETGTAWVRELTASTSGHAVAVAQITSVEIISGLARQAREGLISALEMQKLRLLVGTHIALEYAIVEFEPSVVQRAEDLLLAHPLRAYDAVQLASTLDLRARLSATGLAAPIFVSADRRLLAAAETEGLLTDDPNRHI